MKIISNTKALTMVCKKLFIICIALLFSTGSIYSQNAQLEAKAAYLLAEESYGKGEMRTALDYINDAGTKLGAMNAKLAYLKIMILKEMSVKDTAMLRKLDEALVEFEKAPDAASFNEEKTLEITKIKVERKRKLNAAAEVNNRLAAFQSNLGWHMGMSLDSVIASHKERFDDFFKKNPKRNGKIGADEFILLDAWNGRPAETLGFQKNILVYYTHNFYTYTDDTPNLDKGRQAQQPIINDIAGQVGYLPEPEITTKNDPNAGLIKIYTYNWTGSNLILLLQVSEVTGKTVNLSSCTVTLVPNSKELSK